MFSFTYMKNDLCVFFLCLICFSCLNSIEARFENSNASKYTIVTEGMLMWVKYRHITSLNHNLVVLKELPHRDVFDIVLMLWVHVVGQRLFIIID